jgi:hypothetical protein
MGYAEDVKAAQEAEAAKFQDDPQVEIEGTELAVSPEGVQYQGGYPTPVEEVESGAKSHRGRRES